LPSFFPADLAIPTVAPKDVGEAAAKRMLEPAEPARIHHGSGEPIGGIGTTMSERQI
jgi:hypothetical protein